MGHKTLQAKQGQQQNFQQQENSNVLYTVNWAAELDNSIIFTSTWVQNNGTGTVSPSVDLGDQNTFTFSLILGSQLRLTTFQDTLEINAGDYIELSSVTGANQEMVDHFSNGRFLVNFATSDIVEVNNDGFIDALTSGTVSVVGQSELKTSKAYIKGNVGTHRITNKITTSTGETMERQVVVRVLSNTDRLADDYFYYGRRGF